MLTLRFEAPGTAPARGTPVNTWCDEVGCVRGTAYVTRTERLLEWQGLGLFAFTPGSLSVSVWPEAGADPSLVRSSFERLLQPVVLQAIGWQVLHASSVGTPDGAIVLAGQSGAGKSTLAFAVGQTSGCRQLADDGVVLEHTPAGRWCQHPLPFAPRLRSASATFFGQAASGTPPSRAPTPVALAAIAILAQAPDQPVPVAVGRLSPHVAFAQVLAHAHCFDQTDPDETRRLASDYLDLAASVPVFSVTYRPAFRDLPELLHAIRDLAGPRRAPVLTGADA